MIRVTIAGLSLAAAALAATPTFNKDVLPILQKQCQACHRPGEIAPMAFLTYSETRPYAKAIKAAVVTEKMPPWFADPKYGHFKNDRRLSKAEVDTLVAWADGGAVEGDAKDKPKPVQFSDGGWSIGKPDMVIEYPHEITLPATGIVDQSNLLVKVNFPKDVWVKAAEVKPGNSRTVHHMKAWVRPPGSPWMKDAPEGELYRGGGGGGRRGAAPVDGAPVAPAFQGPTQDMLAKYNPGVNAQEFTIGEAAKFIPAGSDIVFEAHYTTTGKPETDRSRVGIVFATEPPKNRYITTTGINNTRFLIPALANNHEVIAESIIQQDAQLVWVQPHMHYRAKDYELRVHYPSGESEVLMKSKFDFNWQLGYEFAKPVTLPKGTRLEAIAHYDNSPNNKFNPNPNIDVRYGAQSTDEMAVSFMGFVIGLQSDPGKLFPRQGRGNVQQIVE